MPVNWNEWRPSNLRRCWHDGQGNLKASSTTSLYTSGDPTNQNQIKRSIVDAGGNLKQGLTTADDTALKSSVRPAGGEPPPTTRYYYSFDNSVFNVPITLDNSTTSGIQRVEFDLEYLQAPATTSEYMFGVNQSGNNEQLRLRCRFLSNEWIFILQIGGAGITHSLQLAPLGEVYNIMFRWDSANAELTVNGVTDSTAYPSEAQTNNQGTYIGFWQDSSTSNPFQGYLSDVKFMSYDGVTTIHHWPINDNSNTIVDIAGGQNGTLVRPGAGSWVER